MPPTYTQTPATLTDILANHDALLPVQPTIDAINDPALSAAFSAVEIKTLQDGAASALKYQADQKLDVLPPPQSPDGTIYAVDQVFSPPRLVVVVPLKTDLVPAVSATPANPPVSELPLAMRQPA